jgi:hypothetical protein
MSCQGHYLYYVPKSPYHHHGDNHILVCFSTLDTLVSVYIYVVCVFFEIVLIVIVIIVIVVMVVVIVLIVLTGVLPSTQHIILLLACVFV